MLPPSPLGAEPEPSASGGIGDIYKGTFKSKTVAIKRVREHIAVSLAQKTVKVCYQHLCFLCPPSLTKVADLLQRGSDMETLEAPKHRALPRHHCCTAPAHFGVDPRLEPTRIRRKIPQCGSVWTRGNSFRSDYPMLTRVISCLTSLVPFATFTPAM